MTLAPIFLAFCCCMAFYRPVWGIAILLAAECSIFFPGDNLLKVFLPVGTIGSADVLILCLFLGALRQRKFLSALPAPTDRDAASNSADWREKFARNTLVAAIFPYVLWLCFCAVFNQAAGRGTEGFRTSIRSSIFNIVPWCIVPTVWLLRSRASSMLRIAFAVAGGTALIHLVIQLFDIRSVMLRAYWLMYDPAREYFMYFQSQWEQGHLVRGLPQGIILMLYIFIFSFTRYLTGWNPHRNLRFLFAGTLQLAALVITVTRSLIALCVAGSALAVFFIAALRVLSRKMQRRLLAGALILGMGIAGLLVFVTPEYLDLWITRIQGFEKSRRIFSPTTIRGMNNLASLAAIRDRAVLGYGMNRYPEKYSLLEKGKTPTDIHPFLRIALFSGMVGAGLALWMLLLPLRRFWWGCRRMPALRARMLPYLAILATNILVNSVGAGGTFLSAGLITMALFLGLAAAEFACAPLHTEDE